MAPRSHLLDLLESGPNQKNILIVCVISFLILELVAKEQNLPDASLRSWLIPGQALPLEQAMLFAIQIARGMEHVSTSAAAER